MEYMAFRDNMISPNPPNLIINIFSLQLIPRKPQEFDLTFV